MKIERLSLFLAAIMLMASCDPTDKKFVFQNNAFVTKSFYFSQDSTSTSAIKFYSELSYSTPNDGNIPKGFDYLKPKNRRAVGMLGSWEDYLDRQFKDSTAYVYVIDSSDIGKKPEIMVRDSLVSRYRVTSKYMRENNWELIID